MAENTNTTVPDYVPKAPPLSPHLGIYKFLMGSMIPSILHRATGIALSAGTLLLVALLVATANGEDAYNMVQGFIGSLIGQVMLFGWVWSLCFHLCAGIRYLAFDVGYGFDKNTATTTGWIVVIASVFLTFLIFFGAYAKVVLS